MSPTCIKLGLMEFYINVIYQSSHGNQLFDATLFKDIMNVMKVTIHRPYVLTLQFSVFIRGDLIAAARVPFMCSLISFPFF